MHKNNTSKIIAIHQPNFFPWLGYFHKILNSDIFVFLDHVVANPNQSWIKRVQLAVNGKPHWFSIPVFSEKSNNQQFPSINTLLIKKNEHISQKYLRSIQQNYGKLPYFKEVYPFVEEFYHSNEENLSERNILWITKICKRLEIEFDWVPSSSLNCKERSTDLLVEIVQNLHGTSYLCGGGTEGYQEDVKFEENGIELIYQNYIHPEYQQMKKNEFVQGLSIVDALMCVGFKGTKEILTEVFSMVEL